MPKKSHDEKRGDFEDMPYEKDYNNAMTNNG